MDNCWCVICDFTDEETGPEAGVLLFKGETIEEAVAYLNNLDIDKELSNYRDKKIRILECLDLDKIGRTRNYKWLVISRNSCGMGLDIEAEFDTHRMAECFAYELVNEHPYSEYYLLKDKPL